MAGPLALPAGGPAISNTARGKKAEMESKKKLYAALDISADCVDGLHVAFKRGDELKEVLAGTMAVMIRQGQAVEKKEVPLPLPPPPDKPPEGGK